MQIIHEPEALPDNLKGGVVSLGKFDGVHPGHVMTIECVKEHAARLHAAALVMTFDTPPIHILRPHPGQRPICTLSRKIELLQTLGLDGIVILRATKELLEQSAEAFFLDTFQKKLGAKAIVEGRNFAFGRDHAGSSDTLRQLGIQYEIETDILEPISVAGRIISSSGIRELLRDGHIVEAHALMPKPYRITGTVITGDQRGRTLGFPTANLAGVETVIPKWGLYATTTVVEGKHYASTTHVGPNPTFEAADARIETFLHHFSGDLYGKTLDVDFHARLRDSIRFDSVEELVRQMTLDVRRSEEMSLSF